MGGLWTLLTIIGLAIVIYILTAIGAIIYFILYMKGKL